MKAIIQDKYGNADVLRLGEIDEPEPGDGEVLVRVHAAGVDRGQWHFMTGTPLIGRIGFGLRAPRVKTRGIELSGVVERVGDGVTAYRKGDEVFGVGDGSFAELARAKITKIASKPAGVSHEDAAACAVSAVTALHAIRTAQIKNGQRVLVLGAAGGVGTFAVQLARHLGADVTGVARPAKADVVRGLGAAHVTYHDVGTQPEIKARYDVIIDTAGRCPVGTLRSLLTSKGTTVLVGGEGGGRFLMGMDRGMRALAVSPFIGQRFVSILSITKRDDLDTVAGLLADGSIKPVLDRVVPLAETPEALRYLATGEVRGKVVVTVAAE
ncbi:NAD(P)-dependent alcohol dehydrogenase [Actinoplanes sp. TBRC 11911]|uniref:NAD(P)-dependent alcohol dehydrogenase n=1 Tax=Actinoplanes sp. TBRC 11911 TaxID=2729386 RepID=UPI00145ED5D4|nr:NAD(P)-dependent alcohol dehydrogenase [Actinoplanes sp. TBRC 11911]NMO53180.1 NAD(P)-dependent alcohol dehydrogenase [Actinoplanes sp. TBRC 11911]